MNRSARMLVNYITLYRVIMAPVLLFLLWRKDLVWFTGLLAASFLSDVLDGFMARRYKVSSVAGARLDSLGDDLTILIAIIGMFVLKSSFVMREHTILWMLLALFVIQVSLALGKYRRPTSFHTWLAKAATILQGTFLLLLFILPAPPYLLFWMTALVTGLDLLEEILLVIFLPHWRANVPSIFLIRRLKAGARRSHLQE